MLHVNVLTKMINVKCFYDLCDIWRHFHDGQNIYMGLMLVTMFYLLLD